MWDPLPDNLDLMFRDIFESGDAADGVGLSNDVFDHGTLFPLQRKAEMWWMLQQANSIQPKVVFEIGADKGGGLYHWCKCIPTVERAIGCEFRGTPYSEEFKKGFSDIDFLFLPKSSYDPSTVSEVKSWLGEDLIDVLFIDGDKCKFDVDFDCYLPLMNPNGIVFMHDIQDKAPRDGYDKSCSKSGFRHVEYVDISDYEALRDSGDVPATAWDGWLSTWGGSSCGVGAIYLGEK